ncbi:MAG: glycosyltransferase family 25 protein [Patescibacteria group bacterium]|nr:glycosyltransferase family 25 protein [Patescibacteria group bacterium]MDE1946230.1 glycosyltransferase family 25 protein [Patescibacteria group bacterium]
MKFKTFVINMKKNPDRLAFMSDELGKLGIPFVVQEGIDGQTHDFSDVYDEKFAIEKNGAPLTAGEKGCALSHRTIWQTIVSEKLDCALILEDDVELAPTFKTALDEALDDRESGNTDWEYLAFNYPSPGIKYIRLWLFMLSEKLAKEQSPRKYLALPWYMLKFVGMAAMSIFEGARNAFYKRTDRNAALLFFRPVYLAGCYLITAEGARKLLALSEKLAYTADRIQNVARVKSSLHIRYHVPLLAWQRRDRFQSNMYSDKRYDFKRYG